MQQSFMTVVYKNEDLITFAGKTEDRIAPVPSLVSYLEAMTTKNDKIQTTSTILMMKRMNFRNRGASIRSRVSSLMASSNISIQRKND